MYYLSICAIIKDEDPYLNEWIEWHIKGGVEHFYLYDNCSTTPQQNFISSENMKYCTVIPFPVKDGNPQLQCYRQFLQDYGSDSEWVAFIDADEFMRVVDGTDLRVFLRDYEEHDALYVGWIIYNANGQLKYDKQPVRERFTTTIGYVDGYPRGKSIVCPKKIQRMGIHFPAPAWVGRQDIVDADFKPLYSVGGYKPPVTKIAIDHYFTKSWEEWQSKINKGTADNSGFRKMREFFYYNPDLLEYAPDNIKIDLEKARDEIRLV